jgi:hypothetical protein
MRNILNEPSSSASLAITQGTVGNAPEQKSLALVLLFTQDCKRKKMQNRHWLSAMELFVALSMRGVSTVTQGLMPGTRPAVQGYTAVDLLGNLWPLDARRSGRSSGVADYVAFFGDVSVSYKVTPSGEVLIGYLGEPTDPMPALARTVGGAGDGSHSSSTH